MIKTQHVDSVLDEDIEFRLIKEGKLKKSNPNNHYVSNKELYEECCRYHEMKMKCLEEGKPIPPLTDKIAKAIMQIVTRRCNSRMFVNYTNAWKEEMIGNAIITTVLNGHKFDPKFKNPFAYFTQIANNAIIEQLKFEKNEVYVKYKLYDQNRGFMADLDDDNLSEEDITAINETDEMFADRLQYINDFEQRMKEKKLKKEVLQEEDEGLLKFTTE